MASDGGNGNNTGHRWIDLLMFPPAALAPILLAALIAKSSQKTSGGVSLILVSAIILTYVALSIAYMTLLKKGHQKGARASAVIADGLLFIFATSQMGAVVVFGWIGMALLLAGLMMAIALLSPQQKRRFAKTNPNLLPDEIEKSDIKAMISIIAFPAAFLETDDSGVERIIASNGALSTILGRDNDKMDGQAFSSVIPKNIEERTMTFADAEWVAHRTSKGKQTLFLLSPSVKAQESEQTEQAVNNIIDEETGLYTSYYMKYKAESDVQACKRYKRRLAAMLFKLTFETGNLVQPDEDSKKFAFLCFARMVSVSIRTCDTAYLIAEDEIMVMLPETSQSGSRTVLSRIEGNIRKLAAVECPDLATAKVKEAVLNLFGEDLTSAEEIISELYLIMNRSLNG